MRPLFILLALVFSQCFTLLAADPGLGGTNVLGTNILYEARVAGTNSLTRFKAHINSANAVAFGFLSTNEVPSATNGEPIVVYPMLFPQLKTYLPGQNLSNLLGQIDRVIIPVLVNDESRSSIMLRLLSGTTWTNEAWGQPRLMRDLRGTILGIPAAEIAPDSVPFAVHIPVFNMWLLGHRNAAQEVVFRAIWTNNALGLAQGAILPQAALTEFSTKAQQYPGPL